MNYLSLFTPTGNHKPVEKIAAFLWRSHSDSRRKDSSAGPPVPFLQARIVNEDGRPLPPNQIGELVCQGPNVMQEYYKNEEATKEAVKDGWLYTGDLATVDEDGYLYIVDRKKDMIVSGGENNGF